MENKAKRNQAKLNEERNKKGKTKKKKKQKSKSFPQGENVCEIRKHLRKQLN